MKTQSVSPLNPPVSAESSRKSEVAKRRTSPAQNKALKAYNFALAQEDRYLGSVFVTPMGQRDAEAKTKAAYDACKRLGMTHANGL